jgi:hypothetical protein
VSAELPNSPPGIILVAHEVLSNISHTDIVAALPDAFQNLPREVVFLREVRTNLRDIAALNWEFARRRQAEEIRERLLPLLSSKDGWRIQYYGTAPIPLAMYFGFMVGGFSPIDIYQQRHDTGSWRWPSDHHSPRATFADTVLPEERVTAPGDLIIRLSISHTIDPSDTGGILPLSVGEVDVALKEPHEDALQSREDLEELKYQFDRVIDWAHRFRPNAQLHVFAAITVGAAFRLGMAVNPTIHSPVHLYQYVKSASPRYKHAMVLQKAGTLDAAPTLTEAQEAAELRQLMQIELQLMQEACGLLATEHREGSQPWLKCALPEVAEDPFHGAIGRLPSILDTAIRKSKIDLTATRVDGGFIYDAGQRLWRFDDRLLVSLIKQFPDLERRKQAGRLLLLHEGVHLQAHRLTGATSQQIRRFPKIVEELDYQADVWAYVHDYALQAARAKAVPSVREYFINVVDVGIETFWAFDADADVSQIEIRRINRYLIWYWQLLSLERCSDLPDILRALADRPVIEIAGPQVETFDDRVFYSLEPARLRAPEIALLFENGLGRYGDSMGSRVSDVLRGFRERNPVMIRDSLKSIFDQMPHGG